MVSTQSVDHIVFEDNNSVNVHKTLKIFITLYLHHESD